MSWIERIFNKNPVSGSRKANVPEGVWTKCTGCGQVLYREELSRNLEVCPKCGSTSLTKIERMNGYLGYSRVKNKPRFNKGKMIEISERVSM